MALLKLQPQDLVRPEIRFELSKDLMVPHLHLQVIVLPDLLISLNKPNFLVMLPRELFIQLYIIVASVTSIESMVDDLCFGELLLSSIEL